MHTHSAIDAHGQTSPQHDTRTVFTLAAVNLVTLGALTAPVVALLPLRFDDLLPADQRAGALALSLTLGGLSALIANPLFGALSDRTRGRLGKRRPWMLGGALAGLASIIALVTSPNVPLLIISWVCAQVAFNATLAATAALLADSLTDERRASASGVFTAAAFLGMLPPLALSALFPSHIALVSLIMPLAAVIVVMLSLRLRDLPATTQQSLPTPRPRLSRDSRMKFLHTAPGATSTFLAVWLQRLAMQIALSLTTAFTLYLVIDRMTGNAVTATPVAMIATLIGGAGVVIGSVCGGALASRYRHYLPFLAVGSLGLAIGAGTRAMAETPLLLWIATAIGGLAVGVYLAVNLALAMRVVPADHAGRSLGVLTVAETLPQVCGPMLAALLLRVGSGDPVSGATDNYVALYAAAAVTALLSLLTLPAIRKASLSAGPGESEEGGVLASQRP